MNEETRRPIRDRFALLGTLLAAACTAPTATTEPPRPHVGETAAGMAGEPQELPPADEPVTVTADLETCLRHALRANPAVEAARQRWLAALERVPQISTLPDPRLSARYYVEEVETRVGPQEWAVGISQMFPWFGKLGLSGEIGAAEAEAAFVRYQAAALTVAEDVKSAWYELFYLERALATVRENRDLLEYLEEVVRSRFAAGDVDYADLLRAQVELGRLDDRLRGLEDRRRPLGARLNRALHRPVDAPVPRPAELPAEGEIDETALLHVRMQEWSPELRSLRNELEASQKNVELAEIARRPDFTLGLEYVSTGDAISPGVPGSGEDPVLATLSINLPLSSARYHAIEREARARQRSLANAIASETDRLSAALEEDLYQARDAERRITLYRDTLVPRARQAFEATETAFRAGNASFLDLIDAERALLEFELALERARTDRSIAIARLERLVGTGITKSGAGATRTGEER